MNEDRNRQITKQARDTLERLAEADRRRAIDEIRRHVEEQEILQAGPPDPRDRRAWTAWLDAVAPPAPPAPAPAPSPPSAYERVLSGLTSEVRRLREELGGGPAPRWPDFRAKATSFEDVK